MLKQIKNRVFTKLIKNLFPQRSDDVSNFVVDRGNNSYYVKPQELFAPI